MAETHRSADLTDPITANLQTEAKRHMRLADTLRALSRAKFAYADALDEVGRNVEADEARANAADYTRQAAEEVRAATAQVEALSLASEGAE